MTKTEIRQQYILRVANENGFASIAECARHLNVSIETVRRDINKLCDARLLKKSYGGASPSKSMRTDSSYRVRTFKNQNEKTAVGMQAATLIRSGMIVALDCGESIQAVARCVCKVEGVTFITNSIPTASILLDKISAHEMGGKVIMIGGELDAQNQFSKGAFATDEVDRFNFDIAFISCTAFSEKNVFAYNLVEANYSKHLMNRATSSILIGDSAKFNKKSTYNFSDISNFDKVIIDDCFPFPKELKKVKTELIVATVY